MYDLITLGDITIDLFFGGESLTVDKNHFQLAVGGKYLADGFYESLGGGGANVAVGAAKLGLSSAVCGRVGNNPFKQIIIQKLTSANVAKELIIVEPELTNISTILLTKSGEKTVIHYVNRDIKFTLSPQQLENLKKTAWIYIGNMPDMTHEDKINLLAYCKKNGQKTCLNIGAKDCKLKLIDAKKLYSLADIFFINTHEYADLIKRDYSKIDFNKNCLKELGYSEGMLILTDGKKGAYCYTKKNIYFQYAVEPPKVIDCTGAGDGFIAGFLSYYNREADVEKALLAGSKYAAKIISHVGAQ